MYTRRSKSQASRRFTYSRILFSRVAHLGEQTLGPILQRRISEYLSGYKSKAASATVVVATKHAWQAGNRGTRENRPGTQQWDPWTNKQNLMQLDRRRFETCLVLSERIPDPSAAPEPNGLQLHPRLTQDRCSCVSSPSGWAGIV